uniref:DNA polymerase n=1 Tax=Hymenobacter sp. TaxID=1898978 RepID=UPI00286D4497
DLKGARRALDVAGFELSGPDFDYKLAAYCLDPGSAKDPKEADAEAAVLARAASCSGREAVVAKMKEVKVLDLFENVEMPLSAVLLGMERAGILVDDEYLRELSVEFLKALKGLQKEIDALAGAPLNAQSPKQLGEVLFDKMSIGGGKIKKTKTGQYATGEEILSQLAADNPIAALILEYRQLTKLRSTYVEALPQLVSVVDGRVHTSFNQAVTATGRLSSTNPNLQNIPIRTEKGREIRKAFVPRDDQHVLLAADYSQVELRIMADFSGDATMIEAFRLGQDIHTSTASKVFKVPLEAVDGEMRRKAKTVNFGIIYGISAFGLAQRIGISRKEATEIIDTYFQEFPSVKQFMDESINRARELEYAETLLKRRRYLRDINSRNATLRGYTERNAINAPIQGTAADIIKMAMINIYHWLRAEKLQTRMILQVHDELVFDAVQEEVAHITPKIKELMTTALLLPRGVPLEVEVGTGRNWLQAH